MLFLVSFIYSIYFFSFEEIMVGLNSLIDSQINVYACLFFFLLSYNIILEFIIIVQNIFIYLHAFTEQNVLYA